MKVSYTWLQSYFEKPLPPAEKIAEAIIFGAFEVESADAFKDDFILDIKVLPDRAHDCLSHKGIAREISALLAINLKVKNKVYSVALSQKPTDLKIEVQNQNCRRYIGRIIRGVKVGDSPAWLKDRLETLGQKSINNIVDAANFVLFDIGQPIHVFDLDKLNGGIIVRNAKNGEKITTLDGKDFELNENDLVIADEKNVLAIAGIKGGKIAEVDSNTKNIVIEVANFDSVSVRKTARRLNLLTDAAKRFENNLTPELCAEGMTEMTELVLQLAGGEAEEIVDVYTEKQEARIFKFSSIEVNKILGVEISVKEIEDILKRFGYKFEVAGDIFNLSIPFERLDLNGPHDMAEEIGRVYGYNNIKSLPPSISFTAKPDETFYKILWAKKKLSEEGYVEVMTHALVSKGEVELMQSASDKKFLRTNLSDGLKESIKLNSVNAPILGIDQVRVFEVGTVFKKDSEQINVAYGDKKNITEVSLNEFCKDLKIKDSYEDLLVSGESFSGAKFKPWSQYPFIVRDISVWLPEGTDNQELFSILEKSAGDLMIKEPRLVDTFSKDGRTSYAYRLIFQSMERTLTDEEVNLIMGQIYNKIEGEKRLANKVIFCYNSEYKYGQRRKKQ